MPLFGTRSLDRFDENIGALRVRLDAQDLRALDASKTAMPVVGNRYTPENMARVGL